MKRLIWNIVDKSVTSVSIVVVIWFVYKMLSIGAQFFEGGLITTLNEYSVIIQIFVMFAIFMSSWLQYNLSKRLKEQNKQRFIEQSIQSFPNAHDLDRGFEVESVLIKNKLSRLIISIEHIEDNIEIF